MIITLMVITFVSHGQELRDTVLVLFPKESGTYDANYRNNRENLDAFFERTRPLMSLDSNAVYKIEAIGSASPEGEYLFNEIIAKKRHESVRQHLTSHYDFSPEAFESSYIPEDWDFLAHLIRKDPNITSKDKILSIIENAGKNEAYDDATIEKLLEVEYSRPYWYMYHNIFPYLRSCRIIFTVPLDNLVKEVSLDESEDEEDSFTFEDIDFSTLPVDTLPAFPPVRKKHFLRQQRFSPDEVKSAIERTAKVKVQTGTVPLTLKANTIGYALGVANISAETGITKHISFSLPFYYSGTDYFKSTLKFRVCAIQPEFRYNFDKVPGMYAGVHMGVGWFNYALDGDFRIQDSGGKRPAWGGGLGFGYRMPFKKSPAWGLEFAVGAGIYDVRYDIFYNEDNGPYYRSNVRKTWIGIDNASVAVTYRFDIKRRRVEK